MRGVGCEDSGGSGRHYVRGEHLPSSSQEKRINSGPEREYYTYSDKNPPTLITHLRGDNLPFFLSPTRETRTRFKFLSLVLEVKCVSKFVLSDPTFFF